MATTIEVFSKSQIIDKFVQKPDFPIGKNLTDTVTFQDLVDLGLIKAPTS